VETLQLRCAFHQACGTQITRHALCLASAHWTAAAAACCCVLVGRASGLRDVSTFGKMSPSQFAKKQQRSGGTEMREEFNL
jgi:hypothetical protein